LEEALDLSSDRLLTMMMIYVTLFEAHALVQQTEIYCNSLKMKAAFSSETSVTIYHSTLYIIIPRATLI
jgi:hypothetical protein